MSAEKHTIILGAGLAGLSAAHSLGSGYALLEERDHPGGLCDTVADEGYRFDRTGHLLHLSHRGVRKMAMNLMGDRLLEITRRARIFSHGVYTRYPFQANTYGLPLSVVEECLAGFVQASAHRNRGESKGPQNFEDFILAHFGPGIARHFMIPYNAKLWGVHPAEISDEWCHRFVPLPDARQVVAGALGTAQEDMGYNAVFYYPRGGIGEFSNALAARVGKHLEVGCAAQKVDYRKRRVWVNGQWRRYKALISSIPLDRLLGLLQDPPQMVTRAAAGLRCTSLRYLDVALNVPCGTDHHWTYVPERKYPFYRVGCYSNFSSLMAPGGGSNLYVELAARSPIRMTPLMPRIVEGLIEMGIIRAAADVRFARPRLIKHAYVIYNEHRRTAVEPCLRWLEEQGIYAIGRYGRWEYAAMEDALKQGMEASIAVKKLYI